MLITLKRAHIKPIINFIAAKRMRLYGHVVRMPEGRMPGYLLELTRSMDIGDKENKYIMDKCSLNDGC